MTGRTPAAMAARIREVGWAGLTEEEAEWAALRVKAMVDPPYGPVGDGDFELAVEACALTETVDMADIWSRSPDFFRAHWGDALTDGKFVAEDVHEYNRGRVAGRYEGGTCGCCEGGNARECAPRHANGRSCG